MFGGDFNAVLKKLDVQKGVGFDSKTCKTLKRINEIFGSVGRF